MERGIYIEVRRSRIQRLIHECFAPRQVAPLFAPKFYYALACARHVYRVIVERLFIFRTIITYRTIDLFAILSILERWSSFIIIYNRFRRLYLKERNSKNAWIDISRINLLHNLSFIDNSETIRRSEFWRTKGGLIVTNSKCFSNAWVNYIARIGARRFEKRTDSVLGLRRAAAFELVRESQE